jgi:hypothetical protein
MCAHCRKFRVSCLTVATSARGIDQRWREAKLDGQIENGLTMIVTALDAVAARNDTEIRVEDVIALESAHKVFDDMFVAYLMRTAESELTKAEQILVYETMGLHAIVETTLRSAVSPDNTSAVFDSSAIFSK